jgi:YHS domain-containing protein
METMAAMRSTGSAFEGTGPYLSGSARRRAMSEAQVFNAGPVRRTMGFLGLGKKKGEGVFKDPVCGMTVTPKTAYGKATHEGETFYFCSKSCLDTFLKDEHRYAHGGH